MFTAGFDGGTMPAAPAAPAAPRRPVRRSRQRWRIREQLRRRSRYLPVPSTRRADRAGAVSRSVRPLVPGNGSASGTYHRGLSAPRGRTVNCLLIADEGLGATALHRAARSDVFRCWNLCEAPLWRARPQASPDSVREQQDVVHLLCRLRPDGSISASRALSAS